MGSKSNSKCTTTTITFILIIWSHKSILSYITSGISDDFLKGLFIYLLHSPGDQSQHLSYAKQAVPPDQ
jgi:transposase